MSSLFSLLNVAREGVVAQSAGVDVTGQNISNVNTPGYTKRGALLQSRGTRGGSGGVEFVGINRSFNQFAHSRVVDQEARLGAAGTRSDALAQTEAVIAPASGSIGEEVNKLLASFTALAGKPDEPVERATLLQRAKDLATAINDAAAQLANQRNGLLQQAQGVTQPINEKLRRVAALNIEIAGAQGVAADTAALRDERDNLVQDIGKVIGGRTVEDAQGNMTLFAAGTVLVDGGSAASIEVQLDGNGQLKILANRPGLSSQDVTSHVNNGQLGGIREVRDVDIPATAEKLDQFAYDFAKAVNAVHSTGIGLDGVGGRNFFTDPGASAVGAARSFSVDASIAGQPNRIAAATVAAGIPGGNDVALAMSQLGALPLGGGGPPASRFAAIAGDVGTKKATADSDRTNGESTLSDLKSIKESSSGVSLDEEMVNLTRYQRGFDASVRVLQAASELLTTIMSIGR